MPDCEDYEPATSDPGSVRFGLRVFADHFQADHKILLACQIHRQRLLAWTREKQYVACTPSAEKSPPAARLASEQVVDLTPWRFSKVAGIVISVVTIACYIALAQ